MVASTFAVNGSGGFRKDPFYELLLEKPDALLLADELARWSQQERVAATLAATADNPNRIRIKADRVPDYELRASGTYVRGDVVRISGKNSCNITFTTRGAAALAEALSSAISRAKRRVILRVPSAAHHLVEFIPDVEQSGGPFDDALGASGLAAAAEAWGPEDFSDWEQGHG